MFKIGDKVVVIKSDKGILGVKGLIHDVNNTVDYCTVKFSWGYENCKQNELQKVD